MLDPAIPARDEPGIADVPPLRCYQPTPLRPNDGQGDRGAKYEEDYGPPRGRQPEGSNTCRGLDCIKDCE